MVISVFGDEQRVLSSIEAGATGYLLKDLALTTSPRPAALAALGGNLISPVIARRLLQRLTPPVQVPPHLRPPLARPGAGPTATKNVVAPVRTESRVLHLAARLHLRDPQFLQVSPHTVMTYVKRIYRLQVRSKARGGRNPPRSWLRD